MIDYKNNKFGDINHNGKIIHITQDAYLAGTNTEPVYQAAAKSDDGDDYRVTWVPVDNFMDLEDESECCDWDDFVISEN